MDVFTISALALITAFLIVFIKQYKPEYAALCLTACSVIILCFLAKYIGAIINTYMNLSKNIGVNEEVFEVLVKSLGISYLSLFTAEICRDFGQNSLASKVESAGKIGIMILATPMIFNIIEVAKQLL